MRLVAVFGAYGVMFDDQLGRERIGILPVDEKIRGDFPKNQLPQAYSHVPFQIERVGQMFCDKRHDSVVTVDQVCAHIVAIVVPVEVVHAENEIGAMMRHSGKYCIVLSQQKDARQRNPAFPSFKVRLMKLRAFQQFHIVHTQPRVILSLDSGDFSHTEKQILAKIDKLGIGVYAVLGIRILFPPVEFRDGTRMIRNIEVPVLVSIENTFAATMYLRTLGHIDAQDCDAVHHYVIQRKVRRRVDLLGVIQRRCKIFLYLRNMFRIDADNSAGIRNSEKDCSPISIEKSAYGLKHASAESVSRFLEFGRQPFSFSDQVPYALGVVHPGLLLCEETPLQPDEVRVFVRVDLERHCDDVLRVEDDRRMFEQQAIIDVFRVRRRDDDGVAAFQ